MTTDHTNRTTPPTDLPPDLAAVDAALDEMGCADRAGSPASLEDRVLMRTRATIAKNGAGRAHAPTIGRAPMRALRIAASVAILAAVGAVALLALPAPTSQTAETSNEQTINAIAVSFDEWLMEEDFLEGGSVDESLRSLRAELDTLESDEPEALDPSDEELVI